MSQVTTFRGSIPDDSRSNKLEHWNFIMNTKTVSINTVIRTMTELTTK